jgi:Tol biopolymer transport system component
MEAPAPVTGGGLASDCLSETHPILIQAISRTLSQLVALNAQGDDSVALGTGIFLYGSVWSPDGQSIALRRRYHSDIGSSALTELVLLDARAGYDVILTADPIPTVDGLSTRYRDGPSWSLDGKQLAFSVPDEAGNWRIWAIARSGGQRRLLMPELDVSHFYPSWSPVEVDQLAYVSEAEDGAQQLWVAELGSGAPARARNLTQGLLEGIEAPRWSPDGSRLAVSAIERDAGGDSAAGRHIYLIDVASSKLTRVTHDPRTDLHPLWSPDGASLLVTRTRLVADPSSDQRDLWQISLAGMEETPLPTMTSSSIGSDWYPFIGCGSAAEGSDRRTRPKLAEHL